MSFQDFEAKWNDIKVIIEYGMLSEEKFFDKAKKFALYPTVNDSYLTFDELLEKTKDAQTDKDSASSTGDSDQTGTGGATSGTESSGQGTEAGGTGNDKSVDSQFPTELPTTGVSRLDWGMAPLALGVLRVLLGAGASALNISPYRRRR
jgi:hypothetical protein